LEYFFREKQSLEPRTISRRSVAVLKLIQLTLFQTNFPGFSPGWITWVKSIQRSYESRHILKVPEVFGRSAQLSCNADVAYTG
jgi:hypothetical protein